jgi:hypothetical protein
MKKLFLLLFAFQGCTLFVSAQTDTLPKFKAIKKKGEISISWINGYKNVSQVNIQRSKDSTRNFSTIHSLSNPNVKSYSYIDKTAKNDSGFYRIFILFEGSNYIFTPSKRLFIDTVKIVVATPGTTAVVEREKERPKDEKPKEEKAPPPPPKPVWVPSVYIFTGDDGNAVIKIPDVVSKKYSIKFMKEDGSTLFVIPQVKEQYLTLDKVNFLKSGWYYFELMEDGKLKEKNKFLITRDN